jgi:hypothetical protein
VELTADGGGRVPALTRSLRGEPGSRARWSTTGGGSPVFRACRCAWWRSTAARERSFSTHSSA